MTLQHIDQQNRVEGDTTVIIVMQGEVSQYEMTLAFPATRLPGSTRQTEKSGKLTSLYNDYYEVTWITRRGAC